MSMVAVLAVSKDRVLRPRAPLVDVQTKFIRKTPRKSSHNY